MARLVWAILQPHSKRGISESDFLFRFDRPDPPTPEEYRQKAMRAYLAQGGMIAPSTPSLAQNPPPQP